eukprot:TRINITY_DN44180_c0_g1_i1.p1 TRINITY_DN44180_c0_g1~~TRINITY_DN44180_c0_g1_i1.p1  ORF type:complete len:285 (-),score=31.20 TRINITY_DN44180_c0_g1_i1:52-906(-)
MSAPLNLEPVAGAEQSDTSSGNVPADEIVDNIQNVLYHYMVRSLRCLTCVVVLFLAGFGIILYWSQLVYNQHQDDYCDQPLAPMLRVLLYVVGAFALQKDISKHLCCYNLHRDGPEPPLRVRLFVRLAKALVLAWPLTASYLLFFTHSCSNDLKLAIKVVLGYYLFLGAFVFVVPAVGVSVIFFLMRRGVNVMPRSPDAAPEGLLDSLAVVEFDPGRFNDGNEPGSLPSVCAICQDHFDSEKIIIQTPCGHIWHQDCLGQWFQLSRDCPMCRRNIVELTEQGQP